MASSIMRAYPTFAELRGALLKLRALGIGEEDLSILAHEQHPEVDLLTIDTSDPLTSDTTGGMMAGGDPSRGIGLVATPAFGPVVAGGFLAGSSEAGKVAAAGGGMAEALEASGLDATQAAECADAVRGMRIVLFVRSGEAATVTTELDRPVETRTQRAVITPEQQAETAA